MKVCVVGGGGREHALAVSLARHHDVVVTPGNAGIPNSVSTRPEDIDADLFVIGPEQPLVDGLADRLRAAGKLVFGPGAAGARLEGSKAWMKQILREAGVPTAAYLATSDVQEAADFLSTMTAPYVVKTDGLAAGKGVLVTNSLREAQLDVLAKLSGELFGDAGTCVVIEEALDGPEVSMFFICDGYSGIALPSAQDHKRVGDGDTGPNTGGMGAYSPVSLVTDELIEQVQSQMIKPTLARLREDGIEYRGVLFAGLMLTSKGPKLLEYNVRFGDPETQVIIPRIVSDLGELLASAAAGSLPQRIEISDRAAVGVVLAAPGYPTEPEVGDVITGLRSAGAIADVSVFHAGTKRNGDQILTNGGRVLCVSAMGDSIEEARALAYQATSKISWPGLVKRTDIAASA